MPEPVKLPTATIPGQIALADPYRLFGGKGVTQYNPSDLVGRKGLRIYDQIRKDEQAKSGIAFKKHAIVAAGWDIKSPEGIENEWEPRDFVEWCFDRMSGSFSDHIMQMLTCLEYGFAVGEELWPDKPLSGGPFSGKWPMENIVPIKPHCLNFEQDEYGRLLRVVQQGVGRDVEIPIEKLVLMTYQNEWCNPYGRSDYDAVYRAWWNKDAAHKWLAMLLERFGIPPIFALYDDTMYDRSAQEELKRIVTTMQAGTSALIPRKTKEALELWTPQLATQVADVFLPALDHYDSEIARGLLMPSLLGTTPEKQEGSYARAAVVFDVFMMAVDALRTQVEEVVNDQIIWRIISFNYPIEGDEYPRFSFKPLTQDSRIGLMDTWVKLLGGKAVISRVDDESHVREIMGFPTADSEPIQQEAEPEPEPSEVEEDEPQEESLSQRSIDFKAIEKRLDANEDDFISNATRDLELVLHRLQKTIKPGMQPTAVKTIRGMSAFEESVRIMMLSAFYDGRSDLASEAGVSVKLQALPRVNLRDAIAFIKRKAAAIAERVSYQILIEVKRILVTAAETGMVLAEMSNSLGVVFQKWIGSVGVLRDGKPITPSKLEEIARTETTNAYNHGRVVMARDPKLKGLIRGLRHDSILDSRTTVLCRSLNGKIHRIDSPDLDALTPPLHSYCRSILTPIKMSIEINESEFITPSEVGRAKELAGSGFAGGGSF